MDKIVSDVQSLFRVIHGEVRHRVGRIIANTSGSTTAKLAEAFLKVLDEGNPLIDVFTGLQTQHQQMCFFPKPFKLIVSAYIL